MHTLTSIPFNSRYQKGKTNLDFTEARDSEWQWHQLGHVQVCTSLQTDNHASTPPLSFLQAGCPCCHPTNSVKALCYINVHIITIIMTQLEKSKKDLLPSRKPLRVIDAAGWVGRSDGMLLIC